MTRAPQHTAPRVNYVDAICGAGKSHKLKEHFLTLNKQGQRFIVALPTDALCDEFKADLDKLKIGTHYLNSSNEGGAGRSIIRAMSADDYPYNIICTHGGLLEVCKRAAFDDSVKELLSQFDVFIDEVPDSGYGAQVKIRNEERTQDNFPFLQWLEEREGLHYIKEDSQDEFYQYFLEKEASGDALKKVLFAALDGRGILIAESAKLSRFFSFTITPIARCAEWANNFTVSGAGVSRSSFIYLCKLFMNAECVEADYLLPSQDRRVYPNKNVKIYSLFSGNASLDDLDSFFTNNIGEVIRTMGKSFTYACNNDKDNGYVSCAFSTIADRELGEMGGERLSMKCYGLNSFQHINKAAFLGVANLNNPMISDWVALINASGGDGDLIKSLFKSEMNYEQAYQFVSRCGIRDFDCTDAQVYMVPDLACAEYLKQYYFPEAEIECLHFDKKPKERKARDTHKGDKTKSAILKLLKKGLKNAEIGRMLGVDRSTVSKAKKTLETEGRI